MSKNNESMQKPVVGIILDSANNSAKYSYSPLPWYALRQNYSEAISNAGGVPILLPYHYDIDELLSLIDGLIIPGGDEDINPKFYNQEIKTNKITVNDQRAEFEIKLMRRLLDINMPFLGICNGMQVLNVVCGGTLIQHIPDTHQSQINHEQPEPKNAPSHEIIIQEDSILETISPNKRVMVNSTHHQAVDKVAKGLKISALAPDGIVEAIESENHKFVIGVEWHCEHLNSELDSNLFKRLVEEARSFR